LLADRARGSSPVNMNTPAARGGSRGGGTRPSSPRTAMAGGRGLPSFYVARGRAGAGGPSRRRPRPWGQRTLEPETLKGSWWRGKVRRRGSATVAAEDDHGGSCTRKARGSTVKRVKGRGGPPDLLQNGPSSWRRLSLTQLDQTAMEFFQNPSNAFDAEGPHPAHRADRAGRKKIRNDHRAGHHDPGAQQETWRPSARPLDIDPRAWSTRGWPREARASRCSAPPQRGRRGPPARPRRSRRPRPRPDRGRGRRWDRARIYPRKRGGGGGADRQGSARCSSSKIGGGGRRSSWPSSSARSRWPSQSRAQSEAQGRGRTWPRAKAVVRGGAGCSPWRENRDGGAGASASS